MLKNKSFKRLFIISFIVLLLCILIFAFVNPLNHVANADRQSTPRDISLNFNQETYVLHIDGARDAGILHLVVMHSGSRTRWISTTVHEEFFPHLIGFEAQLYLGDILRWQGYGDFSFYLTAHWTDGTIARAETVISRINMAILEPYQIIASVVLPIIAIVFLVVLLIGFNKYKKTNGNNIEQIKRFLHMHILGTLFIATALITFIVEVVWIAVPTLVVAIAVYIIMAIGLQKALDKPTSATETNVSTTTAPEKMPKTQQTIICNYCNGKNKLDATTCEHCGATNF